MSFLAKIFGKKTATVPKENPMQTYVQSDAVDYAWGLYGDGKLSAPFVHLLDYVGGVNGEGHNGFLDNHEYELDEIAAALRDLLPEDLFSAFGEAMNAYRSDKQVTKKCDAADRLFYEREYDVMQVVERYARALPGAPEN